MTREQQVILELIRKAVHKDYQVDTSAFSYVRWVKVINLATEQGVLGITFDAIDLLLPKQRPDIDNLMEWLGQASYIETQYQEHKNVIAELGKFYDEYDIRMMLLKGYGLSLYWPKPEHRPVGDIDIYLFGDWKKADCNVEEKLGIEVEKNHHHHTCFEFHKVLVENHYDFINVHAHSDAPKIETKLKELASSEYRNVKIGYESINVYLPSTDFNALFLMRHMGQHFAGERVTLRQLLDWYFFIKHENGNIHWNEIDTFLKEIGLYDFKVMINNVCEWLFFSPDVELTEIEKRIVNDVLSPEFSEDGSGILFQLRRWMANRWKHKLVYDENLWTMFITLGLSHLIKPKID